MGRHFAVAAAQTQEKYFGYDVNQGEHEPVVITL
jgi:hypothetical protein